MYMKCIHVHVFRKYAFMIKLVVYYYVFLFINWPILGERLLYLLVNRCIICHFTCENNTSQYE